MSVAENIITWFGGTAVGRLVTTIVAVTAFVAVRYYQTGKFSLASLPWRAFRRLIYTLRRTIPLAQEPWPSKSLAVDMGVDELRVTIAVESYNPRWVLSYQYKGEDLNARRYYYDPSSEYPHRQLHIRAKKVDEARVEMDAHDEPAPEHHPKAHLLGRTFSHADEWVASRLESNRPLDPQEYSEPGSRSE